MSCERLVGHVKVCILKKAVVNSKATEYRHRQKIKENGEKVRSYITHM